MKKKCAMLSVSLTVLMTIFFIMAHYSQAPLGIVILDKDRLISAFVRQLSTHTVSDRLLRLKTNTFRDAMTHSITFYAQKNKVLVLDKKQVLAGGRV
jgi:hypothetical protein